MEHPLAPLPPSLAPRQAATDQQLNTLCLHWCSPHTQRAYAADVARFLDQVQRPLAGVTLADVQAFADCLAGLAPSSQARILSPVKSLLTFGHRLGLLPVNAGAVGCPKLTAPQFRGAEIHKVVVVMLVQAEC